MQPLSRKRKPLGPRQRAAYVKPFRAELEAAKAKVQGQEAARAAAEKRIAALTAPALLRKATGTETSLVSTLELSGYGLKVGTPAEVKAARKALLEGELSIQIGGGSPKLPSLARRFRRMSTADTRRLKVLDRKIAAAHQARTDLIVGAFDRAVALPVEALATAIIEIAKAKHARPAWIDSHAILRAQNALEEAMKHDGTATCPCQPCEWARKWAAQEKARTVENEKRAKAEVRRLAKLGQVTFTCPSCKAVNEHSQVDEDEDYPDGKLVMTKFVECSGCEESWPLAEVTTQPVPGQVALVA